MLNNTINDITPETKQTIDEDIKNLIISNGDTNEFNKLEGTISAHPELKYLGEYLIRQLHNIIKRHKSSGGSRKTKRKGKRKRKSYRR